MKRRCLKLLKEEGDFRLYEIKYPMRTTSNYIIYQKHGKNKWSPSSRKTAPHYDQMSEIEGLDKAEQTFEAFKRYREMENSLKK
jgi:hypothetical protein